LFENVSCILDHTSPVTIMQFTLTRAAAVAFRPIHHDSNCTKSPPLLIIISGKHAPKQFNNAINQSDNTYRRDQLEDKIDRHGSITGHTRHGLAEFLLYTQLIGLKAVFLINKINFQCRFRPNWNRPYYDRTRQAATKNNRRSLAFRGAHTSATEASNRFITFIKIR